MSRVQKVQTKEVFMETQPLFMFVVRKAFATYKVGDVFEAMVRTFVTDLVERQDFELPDGVTIKGVPCSFTQFVEKNT